MNKQLENMVREFSNRGYQLIPRDNQAKKPKVNWRHYHTEWYKNTDKDIEKWIAEDNEGFCLLTGDTSHGLEVLDFDTLSDKSNVYEWFKIVAGDLIKDCPTVKSGGGGIHIYYRRQTTDKSTKLAYKFDQGKKDENDRVMVTPELKNKRKEKDDFSIVIETRCNRSYIVCPYSAHKSGKSYQPSIEDAIEFIENIPLLDDETVTQIHRLARTFNELHRIVESEDIEVGVVSEKPNIDRKQFVVDKSKVIDYYNSKVNIDWILEKYGYTYHSQRDETSLYYCRPGRDTIPNVEVVHTTDEKSWVVKANRLSAANQRSDL